MERKALYAGSFDPVTNGHLNIIERAAKMFDSLTVAVTVNPNKTGLFSIEERRQIIEKVTSHIPNVAVDTCSGLIADYVNANGFCAYVRGLRNASDFEAELQMAHMNARLFSGDTETIFLVTDPEYSFVSSSLVKEVASLGGSADGLIPAYAYDRLKDKLSE